MNSQYAEHHNTNYGPEDIPSYEDKEQQRQDLLDLARNIGGFDDGLLLSADLNMIRATMREWRDQARTILAVHR